MAWRDWCVSDSAFQGEKGALKRARQRVRPCFHTLTGDNTGAFRLFVRLQLAVVSCRRVFAASGTRRDKRGLTSADDAPLAVQHQPALRFHGALRRQALIRRLETTRRCWSRAGSTVHVRAFVFTIPRNYFKGNISSCLNYLSFFDKTWKYKKSQYWLQEAELFGLVVLLVQTNLVINICTTLNCFGRRVQC